MFPENEKRSLCPVQGFRIPLTLTFQRSYVKSRSFFHSCNDQVLTICLRYTKKSRRPGQMLNAGNER